MNVNRKRFRLLSFLMVFCMLFGLVSSVGITQAEGANDYVTAVSVNPTTIVPGQAVNLTAEVTAAVDNSLLIDLEIFNQNGQKVFQDYRDNQTVQAGQKLTVPFTWTAPANLPNGRYIVSLGVFGAGWGAYYKWHAGAATFTVSSQLTEFTSSASVGPEVIIQGGTAEIKATVAAPADTNALVTIGVLDSAGTSVFTQEFANQALVAGQVKQLMANWAIPAHAAAGPYQVVVGVYNADKTQTLHLNNSAASFTVKEAGAVPLSFTTRAVVPVQTVLASNKISFVAEVISTRDTSVLVDVEVFDPNGHKAFYKVFDNQAVTAGQALRLPVELDIPQDARGGTYKIQIGIFKPGWGENYDWNSNAGSFTVTPLTFSSTGSATPTGITAGEAVQVTATLNSSTALKTDVELQVFNPLGTLVHQQRYDDHQLTAGANTFTTNWSVPTDAYNGEYGVNLRVTSTDDTKTYHRNNNITSFDVTGGVTLNISSNATTGQAQINPRQTVAINASVLSSADVTANAKIAVYDPNGALVSSQEFDNQSFSAGVAKAFTHSFTATRENIDGTYRVDVELYNADKSFKFYSNQGAATFTLVTPPDQPAPQPAEPRSMPEHLSIGVQAFPSANGLYGWMPQTGVPFDFAYQYLNAGANTANGWKHWETGNFPGSFAYNYAKLADQKGYTPYFTYYQMLQSDGSCNGCGEHEKDISNLNNPATMKSYYEDFKLLMKLMGTGTYDEIPGFGKRVVVQVEPDLHGYAQQAVLNNSRCFGYCTGQGNDPSYLKASVASSGLRELADLPNTYQGYNWALLKLRDLYAPNVILAFHVSSWGTLNDVGGNKNPSLDIVGLGQLSGSFAAQSGTVNVPAGITPYDLIVTDVLDRDAAFYKKHGSTTAWWDRLNVTLPNFHQWETYYKQVLQTGQKKGLVWQIPLGNQYFRTMDNTEGHYQDNRVEYFFSHIEELADVGIVGLLFGYGQGDQTAQFDSRKDGITNPEPICTSDGLSSGTICNNHESTVADDDGGYLRMVAGQYYQNPYLLP